MPSPPPAGHDSAEVRDGAVDASMRNVHYQVDPDIRLTITGLQGALLPTKGHNFPIFDDPTSFDLAITDGLITIDTASLGRLLTRHVFAYEGSALRDLRVSVKDGELVQKGRLKKGISLPFTIQARLSLTPEGEIRLDPHKVEVLGMGVRGFMDLLGLELDDLVKSNRVHGVRIVEDVVYLDPTKLLPPPRLRGKLREVRVEPGGVVQIFGRGADVVPAEQPTAEGPVRNYMYFRHARLRFGKLTMHDTDMLVVDREPATPFEFSLDRYHEQLVAGYHVTTPRDGLVVYMPDVSRLPSPRSPSPRKRGPGSAPNDPSS
jgi:hypothetical protein